MSDLGYPMIQARSTNYSTGRDGYSIIWVIIHCTAQAYQDNYPTNLGTYWAREDTAVSVHYGVSDTQVRQYVAHKDTAYQARNPGNLRGVGIEFSGLVNYSRDTWRSHEAMLRNGGKLVGQIAAKHGIPLRYCTDDDLRNRRPGITTHDQLRRVFGGSHNDPGPGFPLDLILNYAQGEDDVDLNDRIKGHNSKGTAVDFSVHDAFLYTNEASWTSVELLVKLSDAVEKLTQAVAKLQTGGVDEDLLAAKISADLAQRLQSK